VNRAFVDLCGSMRILRIVKLTVAADRCPQCHSALTRPETGQAWCASCEWNLRIYDPAVSPPRGWRRLDRWSHRLATRLDQSLFVPFAGERPTRPGWTAARVALTAVSALLVVVNLACLCLGAWLIVNRFPSLLIVPGVLLIVLAVALRPRLGRPPRRGVLRREEAPVLFDLVDRVSAAAGARAPRIVTVAPDFNARADRIGLRRLSLLELGMALWITLPPQLRVALVAHEVGHTVNGDPNRALLIQPALSTFRMLAEATGADRSYAQLTRHGRATANVVDLVGGLVLWTVSRVLLLAHIGLSALALRDHQRAEYLADAIAADVAGTEATVALLDRLVLAPSVVTLIGYNADSTPPARWGAMASSFADSRRDDLPALRQLTERSTRLWDSHPPGGLRARLIEGRPRQWPEVSLSDEESSRIDRELAGWYAATHRRVLGTRDYRERPSTRRTPG
jgi:heat shock protein HtpX